jgi:hypothetical protein
MTMEEVTPAPRAFVEASIAAGFDWIDDFDGPTQNGVGSTRSMSSTASFKTPAWSS